MRRGPGARTISRLLAALILCGSACAARADNTLVDDFAALAQQRGRACGDGAAVPVAPEGWLAEPASCAWQGRLRLRRWRIARGDGAGSCLSAPAAWWTWARNRSGSDDGEWNRRWQARALEGSDGNAKVLMLIERTADGAWSGSEWTWAPGVREATRDWEQARWTALGKALGQTNANSADAPDDAALKRLRSAWHRSLGGAEGEIVTQGWQWALGPMCARMVPVLLTESAFPVPFGRDDSRLEQRAAIQVQLARSKRGAQWLLPFTLLEDQQRPASDAGAAYAAVWHAEQSLHGQVWIARARGAPWIARIDAPFATLPSPERDAAAKAWGAAMIARQLAALAKAIGSDDE